MFKKKLAAILLLFQTLSATIQDPGVEATSEGDPSSSLCDSVSLLTGDFVAYSEDLVINGLRPLRIVRSYVSGNGKGKLGGWEFFPHLEMKTVSYKTKKNCKKFKRAIVREPNGTRLVFKKQDKHTLDTGWIKYTVDFAKNGKGVTNTARGPISGRSNLKNYALYQIRENQYLVKCADGTERRYVYSHNDNTKEKMPVFLLHEEIHPNGHKTFYQYDEEHRLIYIKNTSNSPIEIYAWCSLIYKGRDFTIETSDGRTLSYTFHAKGKSSKTPRYFLQDVKGPELPPEYIEYTKRNSNTDHLVMARNLPDNRKVLAEYNETKNHVETLYQSLGEDGELIPTHHFTYNKERNKPGSTDIFDSEGNKTTIYYSSRYLPDEIHFHEKEELHHSIQTIWDEHGQLLEKIIADEDGAPLLIKKYKYDQNGNVLREEICGNITDKNSEDTYTIYQEYDDLNRLTKKTEPTGLVTSFTYHKQTPLIQTKTITDYQTFSISELTTYNEKNLCVKITTDDEFSRKTQKIYRKKENPALDLPEIIEEWTDGILISKVHLHYNKFAQIVQKDIYGGNGVIQYTLATTYDSRGRTIEEKDANGQITAYEYDTHNNITLEKKPTGKQTRRLYDTANRLTQEIETTPEGNTRTTSYTYDHKNNKTTTTDPFGNTTRFDYDAFSRVTQITHPDNTQESYTYDLLGNKTSHTDPRGHKTTTTYNSLNSPLAIHYPDGTTETYTYYPSGKLKTHTNQDGLITNYTYDALGREIALHYSNLTEEHYTYQGQNLTTHTDKENILTTHTYDTAGRKIATQRARKKKSTLMIS